MIQSLQVHRAVAIMFIYSERQIAPRYCKRGGVLFTRKWFSSPAPSLHRIAPFEYDNSLFGRRPIFHSIADTPDRYSILGHLKNCRISILEQRENWIIGRNSYSCISWLTQTLKFQSLNLLVNYTVFRKSRHHNSVYPRPDAGCTEPLRYSPILQFTKG